MDSRAPRTVHERYDLPFEKIKASSIPVRIAHFVATLTTTRKMGQKTGTPMRGGFRTAISGGCNARRDHSISHGHTTCKRLIYSPTIVPNVPRSRMGRYAVHSTTLVVNTKTKGFMGKFGPDDRSEGSKVDDGDAIET